MHTGKNNRFYWRLKTQTKRNSDQNTKNDPVDEKVHAEQIVKKANSSFENLDINSPESIDSQHSNEQLGLDQDQYFTSHGSIEVAEHMIKLHTGPSVVETIMEEERERESFKFFDMEKANHKTEAEVIACMKMKIGEQRWAIISNGNQY